MSSPKVLFVSHDASRTGAPIVLLHLLRWMQANTSLRFEIVLKSGGPLQQEFEALAPTYVMDPRHRRVGQRWGNVPLIGAVVLSALVRRFRRRLRPERFDVVYCNTVATGPVVDVLADLSVPFIAHVHELEIAIRQLAGIDSFRAVQRRCDHFIAVSDAVRANLVTRHGVPVERVDVIRAFIDVESARAIDTIAARQRLCRELDIDDADAPIIGGVGTTDWRKGPDLFIQLAIAAREQGWLGRARFVWIGADEESLVRLRHELALAELDRRVHVVPSRPGGQEAIAAFDVLALTSREDPFPLVVLEAAAVGVPSVCFDRAGGASEFVADGCGVTVPYLSVTRMAAAIRSLLKNPDERRRLGENARRKVQAECDISVGAARILDQIQELTTSSRRIRHGQGAIADPP